jgi:inward rectifier potassium channel
MFQWRLVCVCHSLAGFWNEAIVRLRSGQEAHSQSILGVNMSKGTSSIKVRVGQVEFLKLNADRRDLRDTYHWMLALTWSQFAALILSIYVAVNLGFSVFYYLGRPCIDGADTFADGFFFSVETLATVGYGHLYPENLYGHVVATIEIMIGMFGMAVITGLIFVRFSRPTARLVFSRSLVIGPFDGQPALMLRVANLRHHAMAEAEFRIMFIRNELTKEGEVMRRFYSLPLQFDRLITFPVALTIRHIIDEKSPLHGLKAADLEKCDARILASIVCIDTVIPAPVQSQCDYTWRDIRLGHRLWTTDACTTQKKYPAPDTTQSP